MTKEKSIFTEVMGDSPMMRILDYLLISRDLPIHQSDAMRNGRVSKGTIIKAWAKLKKEEIIVFEMAVGNAQLYKLNQKNPSVKKLIQFYDTLLYQETEKHLSKKLKLTA